MIITETPIFNTFIATVYYSVINTLFIADNCPFNITEWCVNFMIIKASQEGNITVNTYITPMVCHNNCITIKKVPTYIICTSNVNVTKYNSE